MTDVVGHILLFMIAGITMLLAPLVIGRFVRPNNRTQEKDEIYECGEPTIGSSYIQFDLRFYTVALLFIIFDVEVAFFFPWAAVYGGATQLADENLSVESRIAISEKLLNQEPGSMAAAEAIQPEAARALAITGFFDILVFFGVLMVGFAYVWKRGDLDWVRAVSDTKKKASIAESSG
ncbi:MAG: NADH-quinone oxidoreductase subunit A [Planctomycetaceae bacterium]|nr:NADH-quinone oxidoreductase subunit A [Planctomycetaceae bacterium]